jgi:hypothetical protein
MTRHGVVTAELVGRRFFFRGPKADDYGKWAAYRRLRALRELGLVLSSKPFADQPAVLRVTREGARIADVGLRPAPLVLSELRHSLAVVWLTEYLLAEHRGTELTTERELRAQRYRELRDGTRRTEHGRAPDALLRIPAKGAGAQGDMTVAVELDLTRKDRRAMERVEAEDAEAIAAQFGTRRASDVTHQVDYVTGYSEKGSIKRVDKFNVHPNELRNFQTGQVAVKSVPKQRYTIARTYYDEQLA